ncbi:MAG TPA: hypothetical protein VK607_19560, partial [Kofleriaceae bacterium]|nr:hypothetical protein [Kofleriaceae bacterium]
MNRLGAMMALVVALALAATAAAAPAEPTKQRVPERVPEWVIDPPTGWREDAALTKQTLEEFNAGLVKVGTGRPTHV